MWRLGTFREDFGSYVEDDKNERRGSVTLLRLLVRKVALWSLMQAQLSGVSGSDLRCFPSNS